MATKSKAAAKASKAKPRKYSKEKVIALFMEQGLRVVDIAKKLSPISVSYVSRILFGSEHETSGGISKEQAARRREQAARVKQWAAAKASKKAGK